MKKILVAVLLAALCAGVLGLTAFVLWRQLRPQPQPNATPSVAVSIFTGAKFYRNRATACQRTWVSQFPHTFFHSTTPDPFLPVRALTYDSPHQEDYESALWKCLLGLEDLYTAFPDDDWFYTVGCDTFVVADPLRAFLRSLDPHELIVVGGHPLHLNEPAVNYFSGGGGILLSRAVMERMKGQWSSVVTEWLQCTTGNATTAADAALAYGLRQRLPTLRWVECPTLWAYDWHQLTAEQRRTPPAALHYVTPQRMLEYWTTKKKWGRSRTTSSSPNTPSDTAASRPWT